MLREGLLFLSGSSAAKKVLTGVPINAFFGRLHRRHSRVTTLFNGAIEAVHVNERRPVLDVRFRCG